MKKLWRFIALPFSSMMEAFIRHLPSPLGRPLRYAFYKKRLKYLGENVTIDEGVYILNAKNVSIDDNTWIDKNVILAAGKPEMKKRDYHLKVNRHYNGEIGELKIGRNCHVAPNVFIQAHGGVKVGNNVGIASGGKLYSMSHHYRNLQSDDTVLYKFTPRAPMNEQYVIIGSIVMENNTALGLNSSVLPGVTIHENSWIGVNSCVINDIPPNTIAIGSPAKVVKKRFK